jgi:alpha-beta hydrolase superfamily lysophospholipase
MLVAHGMSEHGGRYARLAQALRAARLAVYALDWPGHGRSVRNAGELGHIADRDSCGYALEALQQVRRRVEEECGTAPLFLLGHSMGSFLSQHYVVEHGVGLAGLILSGCSGSMGLLRAPGVALMRLESSLLGVRHRSALAEALAFGSFNRRFAPARTPADWLSSDEAEVDKYLSDRLCGFRCSSGLWGDLLASGASLSDPRRLSRIPKDLPVLLLAGTADPVSQGRHGPQLLAKNYRSAAIADVTVNVYTGARHELFNEIPACRKQVTEDLLDWLGERLS